MSICLVHPARTTQPRCPFLVSFVIVIVIVIVVVVVIVIALIPQFTSATRFQLRSSCRAPGVPAGNPRHGPAAHAWGFEVEMLLRSKGPAGCRSLIKGQSRLPELPPTLDF